MIEKYFNAEKNESILFLLAGIGAILLAVYFLVKIKQPFYNGLAYAFITIAIIQITVGSTIYFRSPKDIIRVSSMMQSDKSKISKEEIPRMQKVMKNFKLFKWIEIFLTVISFSLFLFFPQNPLLRGIGLGLFIQAILMLAFDFFAENRGKSYLEFLQTIN